MLLDEGVLRLSRRRLHADGRPRRARAAGEPARVAQRAPRPARRRGPRHARARRGRGRGLPLAARSSSSPSRRGARPCPATSQRLADKDLVRSADRELRRRDRVPLQAHPRPRHRLPGDREDASAPRCTSSSPTGSNGWPASASPSTRRSSATTSSRATATGPSSARVDDDVRSLGERAASAARGSRPPRDRSRRRRSGARTCSAGRRRSSPPRAASESRSCSSSSSRSP